MSNLSDFLRCLKLRPKDPRLSQIYEQKGWINSRRKCFRLWVCMCGRNEGEKKVTNAWFIDWVRWIIRRGRRSCSSLTRLRGAHAVGGPSLRERPQPPWGCRGEIFKKKHKVLITCFYHKVQEEALLFQPGLSNPCNQTEPAVNLETTANKLTPLEQRLSFHCETRLRSGEPLLTGPVSSDLSVAVFSI